jgi:hypothetical protein
MDNFLSSLTATVSLGLRHVFVPGAPLFPVRYSESIVYHFFIISNQKVKKWNA